MKHYRKSEFKFSRKVALDYLKRAPNLLIPKITISGVISKAANEAGSPDLADISIVYLMRQLEGDTGKKWVEENYRGRIEIVYASEATTSRIRGFKFIPNPTGEIGQGEDVMKLIELQRNKIASAIEILWRCSEELTKTEKALGGIAKKQRELFSDGD